IPRHARRRTERMAFTRPATSMPTAVLRRLRPARAGSRCVWTSAAVAEARQRPIGLGPGQQSPEQFAGPEGPERHAADFGRSQRKHGPEWVGSALVPLDQREGNGERQGDAEAPEGPRDRAPDRAYSHTIRHQRSGDLDLATSVFVGFEPWTAHAPGPARMKRRVAASNILSRSAPFQPFAGICTNTVVTSISQAKSRLIHRVAMPRINNIPPTSSRPATNGASTPGAGTPSFEKKLTTPSMPPANF